MFQQQQVQAKQQFYEKLLLLEIIWILERIIKMITDEENPTDVNQLLVVTFTRAAASEMKERIREALEKMEEDNPNDLNVQKQLSLIHNANISTIDSFCARVVKDNFDKIDLDPNFRIADENEIEMLQSDIVEEMLEEYYLAADDEFMELAEKYSTGKTSDSIGELILRMYKFASGQIEPEKWIKEAISVYDVSSKKEMEQSKWMQGYLELQKNRLEGILSQLNIALTISESEDGPKCAKALTPIIDKLQEITESRTYSAMQSELQNIPSTRVSGKKDCNERKKEQVKAIKNDATKAIKDLTTKQFNLTLNQVFESICETKSSVEYIGKLTLEFMKRLKEQKEEKGIMDFNDQAFFALHILNEYDKDGNLVPSETAKNMATQFKEIMIDEYQDSNIIQEAILSAITKGFGINNMFMVGDVKQSIYRFRLARPELFMEKYHSYSLEDAKEQRVDLYKNFRSRREVLSSVNYIFRQIMGKDLGGITYDDENALYTGASFPEKEHTAGEKTNDSENTTEVLLIEKDGEELSEEENGNQTVQELEALAIAQRIRRMVGNEEVLDKENGRYRKVEYGDIVILLRSATGWAEPFSQVLTSKGIPVYSASRTGYFSAQEVVILLNYLRVCDNPLQDIPLTGVLHSPIVGCTVQELAILKSRCPDGMLYESLCAYCELEQAELTEEEKCLQEKLCAFQAQLEEMRNLSAYTPVHELILHILSETGYADYVKAVPGGAQRGANIHMLVEKAMDYEKTSYRGLFNFVRYIEKLQKYEVDFGEVNLADAGSGAVQIMTIHKSKGLEFPVVFAAGMGKQFNFQDINSRFLIHPDMGFGVDVILPEKRLILSAVHKQIIRRQLQRESLGEELRVLYVALTRAKEKLIITGCIGKLPDVCNALSVYMNYEEPLLPMAVRGKARTYWSYILPALARHPAMQELFHEYGITERPAVVCEKENAHFTVHKVTVAELVQGEILGQTDTQMQEKFLKEWDSNRIYDEEVHKLLKKRFSYQYPYAYLRDLPVKVSVSELKKRSWHGEDDREEALFSEPDIVPLVPDFISGGAEEYKGAARGTAYHRLMECLDYTAVDSENQIHKQITALTEAKKMAYEEAQCIRIQDIMTFLHSEIGQRMKKAFEENQLYREQPFVLAQSMKNIEKDWNGEETVLVQGIIDAYFVENDEIVLVDYKTDKVRKGEEQYLIDHYHTQLEDYAQALERMLQKKVKETYIYSFTLGKMIPV